MLSQVRGALGYAEPLDIVRARTDHPLDLGDLARHQGRVAQGADPERDVDLLGEEVDRAIGERHIHAHIGIALVKIDERRRQMPHAERDGRVDAQEPARLAGRGGHFVLEAVHRLDETPARQKVGLAFGPSTTACGSCD